MDLLTGGDHLAVLDFLYNGTHLAGGHHSYRQRRREAQGTSGWRPSPSLPQRRVLSLSPPALGRTGQALTFPGGLRDQGRGVLGGQAAGKGGPVSPVVLVGSPAPREEEQLGRPQPRGDRSQQIGQKSQQGVYGKEWQPQGQRAQAQWAEVRKGDTPTEGPEALCGQPGIYKEKLSKWFLHILKGPTNKLN